MALFHIHTFIVYAQAVVFPNPSRNSCLNRHFFSIWSADYMFNSDDLSLTAPLRKTTDTDKLWYNGYYTTHFSLCVFFQHFLCSPFFFSSPFLTSYLLLISLLDISLLETIPSSSSPCFTGLPCPMNATPPIVSSPGFDLHSHMKRK